MVRSAGRLAAHMSLFEIIGSKSDFQAIIGLKTLSKSAQLFEVACRIKRFPSSVRCLSPSTLIIRLTSAVCCSDSNSPGTSQNLTIVRQLAQAAGAQGGRPRAPCNLPVWLCGSIAINPGQSAVPCSPFAFQMLVLFRLWKYDTVIHDLLPHVGMFLRLTGRFLPWESRLFCYCHQMVRAQVRPGGAPSSWIDADSDARLAMSTGVNGSEEDEGDVGREMVDESASQRVSR